MIEIRTTERKASYDKKKRRQKEKACCTLKDNTEQLSGERYRIVSDETRSQTSIGLTGD